ncbi:MAG: GtrA family protein [Clostridia bacterium]|nr:GtrA family protein [Clostridia bacterium]
MELIKNITQTLIDFILKISEKIFPKKLLELEKKLLSVEIVLYIFFGVLTTLINIGTFSLLRYKFNLQQNLANIVAIIIAVLFAYFTNKGLVFNSQAVTLKDKLTEFGKFMLGRAFTMVVELVGCYLMFKVSFIPEIVSKITITILVIILNFFISKFFAFKHD